MLASEETLTGNNITELVVDLLSTGTEATSPAAAGYAVTTPRTGFRKWQTMRVDVTLTGATGGALDVLLDTSRDGVTWHEMVHFAQVSAAAAAASKTITINRYGGYIASIGVGTLATATMVLAAGSAVEGQWFDQIRVRFVAGSGTSAGATQVVKLTGLVLAPVGS